jgi:hypothetical protein
VVGSKKVEGDVWLRADNPTVMWYRRNVKQIACSQLEYCTIVERGRRSARQDKTDMLHLAARGTHARSDVFAPLPSRLVGGASNSHSPDAHQLEAPLLQHANFIRRFEALEDDCDLIITHSADEHLDDMKGIAGCGFGTYTRQDE